MTTFEQPAQPRYRVHDLGDRLQIVIPSRKHVFVLGFLSFWLLGWIAGEVAASAIIGGAVWGAIQRLRDVELAPTWTAPLQELGGIGALLFLLFWLTFWTVGGAFAWYTYLWMWAGREILEIAPDGISIRRKIFGLGRTRGYAATHVQNLRLLPFANTTSTAANKKRLAFDYGAKTIHFGGDLTPAEGQQVLGLIMDRFPQYRHS